MIGLALILTLVPEFVYLRDMFGTRMNTVFKFYYQAWLLLALASAYGVSRLAERGVALWLKLPALILTGLLVLGSLWYPLAAIPSKADNFQGEPTLDGLAYLRRNSPGDVAAIAWIRSNVAPDAVVLEATGGSYSPEGAGGSPCPPATPRCWAGTSTSGSGAATKATTSSPPGAPRPSSRSTGPRVPRICRGCWNNGALITSWSVGWSATSTRSAKPRWPVSTRR